MPRSLPDPVSFVRASAAFREGRSTPRVFLEQCLAAVKRYDTAIHAFVTLDVLGGGTGPRISPFNADVHRAYESLTRLDRTDARLVLPGHGQAWTGGLSEALRLVRRAGPPR